MKSRTKIIIGVVAVAGIAGLALIPPTLAHGGKRYQGANFSAMGHRGPQLFERFDTDKDGAVTQSEIDAANAGSMTRFDSNKDGKLSLEEYEALWMEKMRERMVSSFQRLDRDGDAIVTVEEFSKPMLNIVTWVDSDGDGKVTRQEMKKMHKRGGHHRGAERRRHRE
jgi:monoamine oxidase